MVTRRWLLGALALSALPTAVNARARTAPTRVTAPAQTQRSRVVQASTAARGHMDRHVARSRPYLRARVQTERSRLVFNAAARGANMTARGSSQITRARDLLRSRTAFNSAARGVPVRARNAVNRLARLNARPKRASSIHSARTADQLYARTLRENRAAIEAWMRSGRKSLPLQFSSRAPVGTVFVGSPSGGRFAAARSGHFVLRKGGPDGFFPATVKLFERRVT